MELVEMFNEGAIDALVAIRCLDEGINIPSITGALILASNDDYREFVQRRGRILRTYGTKQYANIYDVIVLPSVETEKMAEIEFRRFYEYARLAENKDKLLLQLETLAGDYGLELDNFVTTFNTFVVNIVFSSSCSRNVVAFCVQIQTSQQSVSHTLGSTSIVVRPRWFGCQWHVRSLFFQVSYQINPNLFWFH